MKGAAFSGVFLEHLSSSGSFETSVVLSFFSSCERFMIKGLTCLTK